MFTLTFEFGILRTVGSYTFDTFADAVELEANMKSNNLQHGAEVYHDIYITQDGCVDGCVKAVTVPVGIRS